ncbi:MAG: outer membrane protein assembly factor BamA [Rhizobiaceae bacterium]
MKEIFRAAIVALALCVQPIAAGIIVLGGSSAPAEAAVVNRIEVRGNLRMDEITVKSYLTISPGQSFTNQDIDDSVKSLYGTGLFTDVSIYQSGSTLIVEVDESGIVNEVFFEGNKRLKDVALAGIVQTTARSVFSEEKVSSDVFRISEAYSRVGREDATVSYEVVPLANNRVNVVFRVNEGDKTKIRSITFIGNATFGERRLQDVMETKQSNWFSWLRNDDIYDPERLRSDEERLRRFYFNRGFADFQILSTDVQYDEIENQYLVTISVDEGPRYTFGNISIDSTIPDVDPQILYPLLETEPGEYYSSKKVEDTIVILTESFAERGFAFVQVVPRGDRDFSTNAIDVVYQIDEGARVYIERINIVGNDRTRDHVIRREFDISEGDPLNQVLLQRTRSRLESLGFFESVNITTRQGSTPDKMIVTVRVVDKATGEFSVGGGYSTSNGALGEISFSESNFLGRGQYIKLSAGFGTDTQNYGLSFTEPYFLGYRISAGFDLFSETSDSNSNRSYGIDSYGGTLRFGIPISEETNSQFFYSYQNQDTTVSRSLIDMGPPSGDGIQGNSPGELSAALFRNPNWVKSGLGFRITHADLDNFRDPREGVYFQMTNTFWGAGGDAQYASTTGSAVSYTTLSEEIDLVGMLRARGGANWVWGSASNYRTQDNTFQGSRDIRGFESYGFGPRDPVTGDALGGLYYWNATAEVNFPMPFLPESVGIRGAFFADAGQLWGLDTATRNAIIAANPGVSTQQLDDNTLRASVGASVIWASPFGPLRFDYAFPISEAPWDTTREYSFGVSTSF